MTKLKITTIAALVFVVTLVVVFGITPYQRAISSNIPDELRDLLNEQPVAVPSFELVDQKNRPFNAERLKGAWTFMFFGYTNCPDVCPVTLTEMDDAADRINELQKNGKKVQYVFVSVDPARDTPELLGQYVSYFGAKFIAATGNEQELKQLANPLGIQFKRGIGTDNEYIVNHSSSLLLIDPQARYYARFRAPHYAEDIISGFEKILDYQKRQ